jgi:hypothetical protein
MVQHDDEWDDWMRKPRTRVRESHSTGKKFVDTG